MTNPSVLLELAGENHGVAADAAGLSSATPTEPVPVSSVPVSIPNAAEAGRDDALTEARKRLALTMGCLDCNADDVRFWCGVVEFLEGKW